MIEQFSTTEDILRKLVSFANLVGDSYLLIARCINKYLNSFKISHYELTNKEGNKKRNHCRIGPPVDGSFILSGHMDVVPVEGQNWETPPFELTDKGDGNLYGRGACDMKGFLALCLQAIPAMLEADLQIPIYLAFTYDEETGCEGAPPLIDHIQETYSEKPRYALIGEPTMMQPVIGQKGIFVLRTKIKGSAGHSSRVRQEVSAIHEAARAIFWLENKMDDLIREGRIDDRFDPPHSSIHVGTISGGIATNVIADHTQFSWDVRVIPVDSALDIREDVRQYSRKREAELKSRYNDFRINTEIVHQPVPALDTPEKSEILNIIQQLTGNQHWSAVSYATEAGQYAIAGYKATTFGPAPSERPHCPNELFSKTKSG